MYETRIFSPLIFCGMGGFFVILQLCCEDGLALGITQTSLGSALVGTVRALAFEDYLTLLLIF